MRNNLRKYQIFILAILAWGIFLILPYIFDYEKFKNLPNPKLRYLGLLNRLIFILVFYLNFSFLIPRFFFTEKRKLYFLFLVLVLMLTPLLCFGIRKLIGSIANLFIPNSDFLIAYRFTPLILILLISGLGIRLFMAWISAKKMKKEIEKERLKSELALLKSQINPHFLFNTLNNIRSLVRKKSDDAEIAIVKLSQMMRYMVDESFTEKVSLENEIDYISNYIDLQKMRLSENTEVTYSCTSNLDGKEIAPMLLIPFIENAFKHGVYPDEKSLINISIEVNTNDLKLNIKNSINKSVYLSKDETSGIGLKNIRSRLNMLYPLRHELKITEENNIFTVKLLINLS